MYRMKLSLTTYALLDDLVNNTCFSISSDRPRVGFTQTQVDNINTSIIGHQKSLDNDIICNTTCTTKYTPHTKVGFRCNTSEVLHTIVQIFTNVCII